MTPTPDPSALLLIAAIVVGYAAFVAIWPYRACHRCGGPGKLRAPIGTAMRYCPHCRGTGLRLRTARRLWNLLTGPDRDRR